MNILEQLSNQQEVNLDNMYESEKPSTVIPKSTIENKAAKAALLSDDPLGTFQQIYSELSSGNTEGYQQKLNDVASKNEGLDRQSALSILGDYSLPLEQKQRAIEFLRTNRGVDIGQHLQVKAASSDISGETVEEEAVRYYNGVDVFGPVYDYRKQLQAEKNKHGASLNSDSLTALDSFLEIILPFATTSVGADEIYKIRERLTGDGEKVISTIFPGESIVAAREALSKMPVQERVAAIKSVFEILKNNDGILISDDNDYLEYLLTSSLLEDYSNFDRFLDNAAGILDLIGLGGLIKSSSKLIRGASTVKANAHLGNTALESPIRQTEMVNSDAARNQFAAVVESESDDVSRGLTGTSRDEFIFEETMPQVDAGEGVVIAKTPNIQEKILVDKRVTQVLSDEGGIYATPREFNSAKTALIGKLKSTTDLVINDSMTSYRRDGKTHVFSGVYGMRDGGFLSAQDAVSQMRYALRDFEVSDDSIKIMKRKGSVYEEVPFKDVESLDGDYVINFSVKRDIDITDVTDIEAQSVKRNFFDRIPALVSTKHGSFARHLLDVESMLSPTITKSASTQVDKAVRLDKILLEPFSQFSKNFMGMDSVRRQKIMDYLMEANDNGIEFSITDLKARGFEDSEIVNLKLWKQGWDNVYYLENRDLGRTLTHQGFKVLEDVGGTKLFLKPVGKVHDAGNVFDPVTNTVRKLTKEEIDKLYEDGGTLARLRNTESFDGEVVNYVKVNNSPTSYLRSISSQDQILNYRHGYYQRIYKAPVFVVKKFKGYERAIGVAPDTKTAKMYLSKEAAKEGKSVEEFGFYREDRNALNIGRDEYWELNRESGRIAQRRRGEKLADSGAEVQIGKTDSFVLDPVESAIRAARSISGRAMTRESLEYSKARVMRQYGHLMPSRNGQKYWPSSADEIGREAKYRKEAADARSAWSHLTYLENGYINSIDEGFKAVMNGMAGILGEMGAYARLERGARMLAESSPTQMAKSLAFNAYLALNPLRQLIVQSHQAVRNIAYNPKAAIQSSGDLSEWAAWIASNKTMKETPFIKFVRETGMLDAVDRHNLVRGSLSDMADSTNAVKRLIGKTKRATVDVARKFGFDVGEQMNLLSALATVRRKYINQGVDITKKEVRDAVAAEARSLTYSMNFAGDMPYNQNFLNMALQFMQVPHKAIAQVFNRNLTRWERARLISFDLAVWGVPTIGIAEYLGVDILPDNPELREVVLYGAESWFLNAVIVKGLTGTKGNIDFTTLAPYEMTGWGEFMVDMWTGGPASLIANNPSGQLLFGNNPRLIKPFKRMAEFFTFKDAPDLQPDSVLDILKETALISSGFSNAYKASLILKYGQQFDRKGYQIDAKANNVEALAQLFGFPSKDVSALYRAARDFAINEPGTGSSGYEKDIKKVVDRAFEIYSTKLDDPDRVEMSMGVANSLFSVFKDDVWAKKIVEREVLKRLKYPKPTDRVIENAIKYAEVTETSLGEITSKIKQANLPKEEEDMLIEKITYLKNLQYGDE